jgi:hexosaminidase
MRRQRIGSLLKMTVLALWLSLFGAVGSAGAAPYVSSGITLSVAHPAPGGSDTVTASGYQPGSSATFLIFSSGINVGTATVNADGVVADTVTIPSAFVAGSAHTFEVQGTAPGGTPLTQSAPVTLAGGSSGLAFTGAEIAGTVVGGVALIALGTALVLVVRRRRTAEI